MRSLGINAQVHARLLGRRDTSYSYSDWRKGLIALSRKYPAWPTFIEEIGSGHVW